MPAIVYQALATALLLCCVPVWGNVFGDGDPRNGVEDDRRELNSRQTPGRPLDRWRNSAGTIQCDGRNRGSAMILDVGHYAADVPGTFLATAAHVLVDLDTGRDFANCEFHFLALGQVPGNQQGIDRHWVRAGPFLPRADAREPAFGQHDWAFIWLPPGDKEPTAVGRIRPAAYEAVLAAAGSRVDFLLVAFDRSAGALGVSAPCTVVHSTPEDLGGGAWRGHLLDDCDSGDGASGGGLVVDAGTEQVLVGIRAGAHWSPATYPRDRFPSGPPAGSPWDVRQNTNFARAIDAEMLDTLRELVSEVRSQAAESAPTR